MCEVREIGFSTLNNKMIIPVIIRGGGGKLPLMDRIHITATVCVLIVGLLFINKIGFDKFFTIIILCLASHMFRVVWLLWKD